MSSDLNPKLRAELTKAREALQPEIRGLRDLAATSISDELRNAVNAAITAREHRLDLINATLIAMDGLNVAMDALIEGGYPSLPDATLPPDLFAELQGEESDLDAAVGIFEETPLATTLSVDLGAPAEKP